MIPQFGCPVAQLCMIFNQIVDIVDQQRLLNDFNQPLLRPDILKSYVEAIYRKGSALNNVWGFIDGTTTQCARPRRDQRLVFNGHKRYHCLKYQNITTPNGIIANLFDPLEGRRHDSFVLGHSGVMIQLDNIHSILEEVVYVFLVMLDTLCADNYTFSWKPYATAKGFQ